MKAFSIILVAVTVCYVTARPAISPDKPAHSQIDESAFRQSPFFQPLTINDEKGLPRILARPIGFIPIFMLSPPKRNTEDKQQMIPEVSRSGTPRSLNLDSNLGGNLDATVQKVTLYPSLTESDVQSTDVKPTMMENKEGVVPPMMEQPLNPSLDPLPQQEILSSGQTEQMASEQLPMENSELQSDVLPRSKRQYPYPPRPYPYDRFYPRYPHHGYYDSSEEYADIVVDVDLSPRYPYY